MEESQCVTHYLRGAKPEKALMGPAHAISGLGLGMLAIGLVFFFSEGLTQTVLAGSIPVAVAALVVITGNAFVPDLDNTSSSAKSTLGILGAILTPIFRGTSVFVQSIVRTKKDQFPPNPHRGFWHTIVGALLLGGLAYGASSINLDLMKMPFFGVVTLGDISMFLVLLVSTQLFFVGVAKSRMKKLKKVPVVGDLAAFLMSVAFTLGAMALIPEGVTLWLGVSVALGCIIHILGDCFTTDGIPLWFPISGFVKKKFWWRTRFTKLKADDEGLNTGVKVLSIVSFIAGVGFAVAHLLTSL